MFVGIRKYILISLIFFSIIFFAVIYQIISKDPFIDCLYDSTCIQTLIGSQKRPVSKAEKIAVICQCIFAYFLTAGMIVITYHTLKKHHR